MSEFTLNDAQAAAVEIETGPALVVAGAGTGKTRVIVERIRRLIYDRGVAAENILALTFTEKAAAEMQDRLVVGDVLNVDTTIATFNRFGNDLLRTYGGEWGLGTLRLLGETGQLVYLREHFDELQLDYFAPVSNPDGQLKLLADYISSLKTQLVDSEQYQRYAASLPTANAAEKLEKQKHQELANLYARYIAMCRRDNVIDYDDQVYLAIRLLQARPNIQQQLQRKYLYILVDEFQDTNPMQSRFVDLLVGKDKNLMVVGDDDQSIYGWRGATLANILDFTVRYPAAKNITLLENYRSTQPILDAAYRLIRHNDPHRLEVMNNLDKRLHAQTADGPGPKLQHFQTLDGELDWLVQDIDRRLKNGQSPASIAILTRRTALVLRVHDVLEQAGIEHAVAGISSDLYEHNGVRQMLEVLTAIADPLNDMALFHALSGPIAKVDTASLSRLAATARREHQSLRQAIDLSDDPAAKSALAALDTWRMAATNQTVGNLAYDIITESGWKTSLYEEATVTAATLNEVQALSAWFKTLKEFERVAVVASVQNYVANLPTLRSAETSFEDASLQVSDTVLNVLSVHRAKGLEWDTVYIVDCSEGSFPLKRRSGGLEIPLELRSSTTLADEHLLEERRLMYVAVTRARHELILTHADSHGGSAVRKPSRFLTEMAAFDGESSMPIVENTTPLERFAPLIGGSPEHQLPAGMIDSSGRLVLSVSQIATWLECPEDFRYKYILNMPLPPAPQLMYGTLVHSVIERIHKGRLADQLPGLEELRQYVREGLPRSGYASKRSQERAHLQAEQTIEHIYERFSGGPLPTALETPFRVTLADIGVVITGRIDAVYPHETGIEIRDYKTGTSVTTAEKAKSRATASPQLTLYALAWREMHNEMPALLTLDFVETGLLGSVRKQPKSLDTMEHKLADMVSALRKGHYPAAASHDRCVHPH